MYKKISDYGIIGNFHTVALIASDGSIDWLCLPHMDSPSVFAAVLDDEKGGRFAVTPSGDWDSTSRYLPRTNILTTTFRTREAAVKLTDFMPVSEEVERKCEFESHELYRLIEMEKGNAEVRVIFDPRFDYARAATSLERQGKTILARGDGESLILCSTHPGLEIRGGKAEGDLLLAAGEKVWLHLRYGSDGPGEIDTERAEAALAGTERYWHDWLGKSETGRDLDLGPFREMVERSALTLKLLEFTPTGAIAAAATTSLPEEIGGERNWDYRFSWVRDSSMTIEALFNVGHLSEMDNYLRWMKETIYESGSKLQIMYGLRGESELAEEELPGLEGYKGSRPVRIGNEAYGQKQLDIYGEIMDAALRLSNYVGKIGIGLWPFLHSICEEVLERWRDRDNGIWEVRGGPYHFVYSKIMCWVALDRGIRIARRYGFPADIDGWKAVKAEIREEILRRGWNDGKKAFVQHYETDALDASNLLIPFYGFLSYDDPRMISTVEAVRRELTDADFVYRYRSGDALPGEEGTFLICTFWLIDNLVGRGRLDEAHTLLLRMEKTANHLGLFSEEYDVRWHESLGNFPQAFTHIGYINSVMSLCRARVESKKRPREKRLSEIAGQKLLVTRKINLNDGKPGMKASSRDIARDLKHLMNILRGAYFRTGLGRVAYEEMAGSSVYRTYKECSYLLQQFDPGTLKSREEKLAFWINMYNVLVIHGVIELGVRDSVKEVSRFFRRICYRIGGMNFSADDIEHGILRGNHRLPNSISRPFSRGDRRLEHVVGAIDPRIHFALVCASQSCPPIEIYTPESLNDDLEISGRTFLNAGGVRIDRAGKRVRLSKIFRWYADDFGKTRADRLRFIAPYMYREEDRRFLEDNADRVGVLYQPYDWRLNRT